MDGEEEGDEEGGQERTGAKNIVQVLSTGKENEMKMKMLKKTTRRWKKITIVIMMMNVKKMKMGEMKM